MTKLVSGRQVLIWIFALAIHIFVFLAFWIESAPIQLADELLFANLASTSGYSYGNFSLNILNAPQALTGIDPVFFAKLVNLLMALVAVSAILWAFRDVAPKDSLWLTWAVLSSSFMFIGMFLPELVYYCFILISLASLYRSELNFGWKLVLSGLMGGFGLLSKPHALGILLTVAAVILVASRRDQIARRFRVIFTWLGLALAVRFSVGIALAGSVGAELFAAYLPGSGVVAPDLQVDSGQTGISRGTVEAVNALLISAPNYLSIALMFYLPAAFLGLWTILKRTSSSGNTAVLASLAIVPFSMLVASWLFGGVVSTTGDDHSARLLLRYSEFLVPLGWLSLALLMGKLQTTSSRIRLVMASMPLGGLIIFFAGVLDGVDVFVSDSTLLLGLAARPALVAAVAISLAAWLFLFDKTSNSSLSRTILTAAPVTFLVGASIYTYVDIGNYYKEEGDRYQAISTYLAQNSHGLELLVVSNTRVQAATLLMEAGLFESKYALANGYSTLSSSVADEFDLLVLGDEIYPPDGYLIQTRLGEFAVYSRDAGISLEDLFFESNPDVREMSGVGQFTPWGGWVDGDSKVVIRLERNVSVGNKVSLKMARHPFTKLENVIISVGDESVEAQLPPNGDVAELILTAPQQGIQELEIKYFGALPLDHEYGSLERYGLAIVGVRIGD